MRYLVLQDHVIEEFNMQLLEGDLLDDDSLEPDVWPSLLSRGIVQDAAAPKALKRPPVVEEVKPDALPEADDSTEPLEESDVTDKKPSQRRN